MKTITELNSKVWYRLIKVVYIIALAFFVIMPPIGIYYNYEPQYDNDKSYIQCGNGKQFILSKNGIYNYSAYISYSDKEEIKGWCFDGTTGFEKNEYGITRVKILTESSLSGKYELVSFYTKRDWFATIGFSLVSILGALVFFEILRRIFYYIVLGTIRPNK